MLGPTDPKDAPEDALRGIIAKDWEKLGLKAPCNGGDNAVHASASPFEGLAERTNWLAGAIADDVFGKVRVDHTTLTLTFTLSITLTLTLTLALELTLLAPSPTPIFDPHPHPHPDQVLLEKGIPEATVKAWSSDPQVKYDAETAKDTGKEKGSIFDALEDLDFAACVDKCVAISSA